VRPATKCCLVQNADRELRMHSLQQRCCVQTAAVDKAVDNAAAGLDAHLLDVLFTKHQLRQHLDAIKRYLLLGQGDFIETFMGLVGADLERPVGPAVSTLTMW